MNSEEPFDLAHLKKEEIIFQRPLDLLSEDPTHEELQNIIFDYLSTHLGLKDRNDLAYEMLVEAVLNLAVFAPKPATFDEFAMANILVEVVPKARNTRMITSILLGLGAIEFVSTTNQWDENMAKSWAAKELAKHSGDKTDGVVRNGLLEMLSEEIQAMTGNRYSVDKALQDKLNIIFDKLED